MDAESKPTESLCSIISCSRRWVGFSEQTILYDPGGCSDQQRFAIRHRDEHLDWLRFRKDLSFGTQRIEATVVCLKDIATSDYHHDKAERCRKPISVAQQKWPDDQEGIGQDRGRERLVRWKAALGSTSDRTDSQFC
jgi:hypothetical protein